MDWSLHGARLEAVKVSLGVLCIVLGSSLPSHVAAAAESDAATQANGKRFATVFRIRGDLTASGSGSERKLREGDVVYVGEKLRAPALAEAVLKTDDAGMLAVRPSTEFVAERFAAEDKPTDSFTVRLVTGSLRVISGWISRTNRSGNSIVTPSATIGIRGTDHEPYVLSAELAAATANNEGTYDKVNRGGTTLQVGDNKLDIDAGRVGFVRAPAPPPKEDKSGFRPRALLTILMPVLLDKVPNFYVPGAFDAELDRYSQTADQNSQRQLEQRRKSSPPAAVAGPQSGNPGMQSKPAPTPAAVPASATAAPAAAPSNAAIVTVAGCEPAVMAKGWLGQLDRAIARRNAPAIVAMFAPDAAVRATVRGNEGKMTSVDINREELAKSTLAAMKGLKDYKQRRVWTEGKPITAACDRIGVRSVVIEQGRQSGKPYRFEALEEYVLELRAGKWLAIKAETTQQ
ncbi:MAG: hypothetical protein NT042_04685 [Sulfuritalea sp.]|nr:hypothetical protein [Sulfuritalea sp.]